MQLTRFDRWLREKFVYELHIQTLRPPETVPEGMHLFIAGSSKAADELIRQLKENNQMYTAQVVDREAWYVPFIAPKEKSVSWWLFSTAVIIIAVFFALVYLKSLVEDPEFRKNFMEALKLLKS